jgi:hypothetical protein
VSLDQILRQLLTHHPSDRQQGLDDGGQYGKAFD